MIQYRILYFVSLDMYGRKYSNNTPVQKTSTEQPEDIFYVLCAVGVVSIYVFIDVSQRLIFSRLFPARFGIYKFDNINEKFDKIYTCVG